MRSTENRENQIHDCNVEMKTIADEARDLSRAVAALVFEWSLKRPQVPMSGLTEDFDTRLSDIVDDLQGPAWRRKTRLEDEIDDIEWEDLNRSRPVVL